MAHVLSQGHTTGVPLIAMAAQKPLFGNKTSPFTYWLHLFCNLYMSVFEGVDLKRQVIYTSKQSTWTLHSYLGSFGGCVSALHRALLDLLVYDLWRDVHVDVDQIRLDQPRFMKIQSWH